MADKERISFRDYHTGEYIDLQTDANSLIEHLLPIYPMHKSSSYATVGYNINNATPFLFGGVLMRPGYIFITKPNCNLSDENCLSDPTGVFQELVGKNRLSVEGIVRATLDPDLHLSKTGDESISDLVDREDPFIPLLSNTIQKASGFPDEVTSVKVTEPGIYGQTRTYIDGMPDIYSSYDTEFTVRNIRGMAAQELIYYLTKYYKNVKMGYMMPHLKNMLSKTEEYTVRIYRLVMSADWKKVEYMYYSGGSKVMNLPTGKIFNYNNELLYSEEFNDLELRFKNDGAKYLRPTPMNCRVFNEHLAIANVGMRKLIREGDGSMMRKLRPVEYKLFRLGTYPLINPATRELEWYVYNNFYESQKIKPNGE